MPLSGMGSVPMLRRQARADRIPEMYSGVTAALRHSSAGTGIDLPARETAVRAALLSSTPPERLVQDLRDDG